MAKATVEVVASEVASKVALKSVGRVARAEAKRIAELEFKDIGREMIILLKQNITGEITKQLI